jgi:hypothetical protein
MHSCWLSVVPSSTTLAFSASLALRRPSSSLSYSCTLSYMGGRYLYLQQPHGRHQRWDGACLLHTACRAAHMTAGRGAGVCVRECVDSVTPRQQPQTSLQKLERAAGGAGEQAQGQGRSSNIMRRQRHEHDALDVLQQGFCLAQHLVHLPGDGGCIALIHLQELQNHSRASVHMRTSQKRQWRATVSTTH